MGKLSEKKEREKRGCGGFGVLYGKAKGKQNGSRWQEFCENDRKYMQERDR